MPRICPRPCSRLATAAVFISVGVVQFVAGSILLRSKFINLLAIPNFWTSSCNIVVGCLLGMSASVWKRSKKRESKKQAVRRNLLISLLISALILNATTLGILLLGKGSTLLSIHLESSSATTSEILAYAYATSVCCPIVCIVVSIVSISGSCFKYVSRDKSNTKTPLNSVTKGQPRSLRWVYTPELLELSKKKLRDFVLSSSSEFSSDDDRDTPAYQKCADYDVQLVLNHMAQGKRDSILSDSAIMLRQMDLRRKKLAALSLDGSYLGPALSRARTSNVDERKPYRDYSSQYINSINRRDYSDTDANTRFQHVESVEENDKNSKSKRLGTLYKNPYPSEELLNEYQSTASKLVKHNPSQYKKFRERLRTGSEIIGPSPSCISDVTEYGMENVSNAYREPMEMDETDTRIRSKSGEYLRQTSNAELSEKFKLAREIEKYGRLDLVKDTPPAMIDCFSPDDLDGGEDSSFDFSRTSSWASEIVPISVKHSSVARLSSKLVPVPSPVVPVLPKKTVPTTSDDSGIGTMESSSFSDGNGQGDFKDRKHNLSSFRDDLNLGNEEDAQRCLKIIPQSVKKYDLNKMAKMASISEESNLEVNNPEERPAQDESVRKKTRIHYRKKSLSSSNSESFKRSNQDNSTVPRRKSTLKKIWSSALSENQTDFLDQVVDEDSLIGLSEKELIERQFRTRSIRKVIQQRLKEKDGSLTNA